MIVYSFDVFIYLEIIGSVLIIQKYYLPFGRQNIVLQTFEIKLHEV